MPGLASYKRVLAAGEQTEINARGTTIFCRQTTEELSVTARSTQVGQGGGGGVSYSVRMSESEKWFTAEEFDTIEIVNEGSASSTIEILIGYGDFFRPVPDIVNVSIGVPAGKVSATKADETNIDVGNAGKVSLAAANPNRTQLIITALATNGDPIRIGDSLVDSARGTPLAAGETMIWDSTAECFACSEATVDQAAAITEHTTQ